MLIVGIVIIFLAILLVIAGSKLTAPQDVSDPSMEEIQIVRDIMFPDAYPIRTDLIESDEEV